MSIFLTFLLALTLFYITIVERTKRYIFFLSAQGFLLFGIAYVQLHEVSFAQFSIVLLETLALKGVAMPLFLERIRRHNHLRRTNDSVISPFFALLLVMAAVALSFVLGYMLHDEHVQSLFFAISIATILTGLLLIIFHRNIFTHLIGYLVMENGIFLLSLAVGNEMPMLINAAILLDIFMGVLVLGLFVNRLGDTFKHTSSELLSQLKD